MQKDKNTILEGILVKKRKILLPNSWKESYNRGWMGVRNLHLSSGILLDGTTSTATGYKLYGTDIPVVFCYPHWKEMVDPPLEVCIGVEARQWPISRHMVQNYPNGEFHYKGKVLTDEDVIAWLENEENIDSMRKVREWALEYGEKCKKLEEQERTCYSEHVVEPSFAREEGLLEKNKVLVAKYNS